MARAPPSASGAIDHVTPSGSPRDLDRQRRARSVGVRRIAKAMAAALPDLDDAAESGRRCTIRGMGRGLTNSRRHWAMELVRRYCEGSGFDFYVTPPATFAGLRRVRNVCSGTWRASATDARAFALPNAGCAREAARLADFPTPALAQIRRLIHSSATASTSVAPAPQDCPRRWWPVRWSPIA
jgi:hypothetical protein